MKFFMLIYFTFNSPSFIVTLHQRNDKKKTGEPNEEKLGTNFKYNYAYGL